MSSFLKVLGLIPEIWEFIKMLAGQIEKGVSEIELRAKIRGISKAFKNPNRQQAARELDNIFRGKR